MPESNQPFIPPPRAFTAAGSPITWNPISLDGDSIPPDENAPPRFNEPVEETWPDEPEGWGWYEARTAFAGVRYIRTRILDSVSYVNAVERLFSWAQANGFVLSTYHTARMTDRPSSFAFDWYYVGRPEHMRPTRLAVAQLPTYTHPCESCEDNEVSFARYCEQCLEWSGSCASCGNRLEVADPDWGQTVFEVGAGVLCGDCYSSGLCASCGEYARQSLEYSESYGGNLCSECFEEPDEYDDPNPRMQGEEEWDSEELSATRLELPAIPGREHIRTCGVEIEGRYGSMQRADGLALAFYEAGISNSDVVQGYHHGRSAGFAHVEHDSSVDWEAVIGPVNMADRTSVQHFNRAVRAIRSFIKDGRLKFDLTAGCHIHVNAERVSLGGAFNLSHLWAYTEDVFYRLAAARWPVHRAAQGSSYTEPTPKGIKTKAQFGRRFEGERYFALSFNNYFSAMFNNCSCGAVRYDDWANCTCQLGKCTFEFRVFNTTANTRKLHAYLALTQALVAKALSMDEIENAEEVFPPQGFVGTRLKDRPEASQETTIAAWKERLTWMLTELPLTAEEKKSVRYCIEHSELQNVGEDFIEELVPSEDTTPETTTQEVLV